MRRVSLLLAWSLVVACGSDRKFPEATGGAGGSSGEGGSGGSSGGTGGGGGNAAGSGGNAGEGGDAECRTPSECPAPASDCSVASCEEGQCGEVPRAAGLPCAGGVCSGTGICGECVPEAAECDAEGVPRTCSDTGEWVTGEACGAGSRCSEGRCRELSLNWYLQTGGTGTAELRDVGFDRDGNAYVVGEFAGDLEFGTRTLTQPAGVYAGSTDVFVAQVPPAGGGATFLTQIGSDRYDRDPFLSVAPNGNHMVSLAYQANLVRGPVRANNGNTSSFPEYYSLFAGFAKNGILRSTTVFAEPSPDSAGRADLPQAVAMTADGNGAFALLEFEDAVRWPAHGTVGSETLTLAGCNTILARLGADGIPDRAVAHAWCTRPGAKSMTIGPDGNVYVGGQARSGYSSEPTTLGTVTITSSSSALLAKFDSSSGNAIRVLELPCTATGAIDDLAVTPDGHVLAVVRCDGGTGAELVVGDERLTGSDAYLVQFDTNLEPTAYAPVGDGGLSGRCSVAVNPNGDVFVAGSIGADTDFGAGVHAYQGSCERCAGGDAFIAGYDSDLRLLFSKTYGTTSLDHATGVAADAERVYLAFRFGSTLEFEGETLNPPVANAASSVLVSYGLR